MKITLNFSLFRTKRRDKTENQPGQPLFVTSSLRLATRLSGLLSVSTVRNYHTALRSFSSFLDGTDIPVHSLTPHLVSLYADWLTDRGVSANTASCYLRSLRALYNRMARQGRTRRICPFANVFTGNSPTRTCYPQTRLIGAAVDTRDRLATVAHLATAQREPYAALSRPVPLLLLRHGHALCRCRETTSYPSTWRPHRLPSPEDGTHRKSANRTVHARHP